MKNYLHTNYEPNDVLTCISCHYHNGKCICYVEKATKDCVKFAKDGINAITKYILDKCIKICLLCITCHNGEYIFHVGKREKDRVKWRIAGRNASVKCISDKNICI